jgi:hypothetical protein
MATGQLLGGGRGVWQKSSTPFFMHNLVVKIYIEIYVMLCSKKMILPSKFNVKLEKKIWEAKNFRGGGTNTLWPCMSPLLE